MIHVFKNQSCGDDDYIDCTSGQVLSYKDDIIPMIDNDIRVYFHSSFESYDDYMTLQCEEYKDKYPDTPILL